MSEPRPCGRFPDMTITPEFIRHLENCPKCVAVLNYLERKFRAGKFPPRGSDQSRLTSPSHGGSLREPAEKENETAERLRVSTASNHSKE